MFGGQSPVFSLIRNTVDLLKSRFFAVGKDRVLVLSVELAQQLHQHSGGNLSGFRPLNTHFCIRKVKYRVMQWFILVYFIKQRLAD